MTSQNTYLLEKNCLLISILNNPNLTSLRVMTRYFFNNHLKKFSIFVFRRYKSARSSISL